MSMHPRGVFGASCRNARVVRRWSGGFLDSYAFVNVWQDAGDLGEAGAGLFCPWPGDEDVLELDDAAGDRGGIELVVVGDQVGLLGFGQGIGA